MMRKKNKQDWLFHKLPSDQKEYLPTGAAVMDDLPSNLYMHMWPHVHLKHIKQWNNQRILPSRYKNHNCAKGATEALHSVSL